MMGTPHLAAAAPPTAVAMPYDAETTSEATYSAPVVDNEHYDANSRSKRDETAVSKLLSAVASMGGNRGKKIAALMKKRHVQTQEENALTADSNIFDDEQATPSPVQMAETAMAQPQPQQIATPAPRRVNSWLKGMDLSGEMPVVNRKQMQEDKTVSNVDDSGADSLPSSFQAAAMQEIEKPKPAPVVAEAPKPKKPNNAFLNWLTGGKKAEVAEEAPAAPASPAKKTNSYLDNVKFFG